MIVEEWQITPFYFHRRKIDDIINSGWLDLIIQVYNSTADEDFSDTPVTVCMDGRAFAV